MQDHTPGGVLAVSIALPILSIIAVFLRFYTRRLQKAKLGIDDWLTLPALVGCTYFSLRSHVDSVLRFLLSLWQAS